MTKDITKKFRMIFTAEDIKRIRISETDTGESKITIDVHGMKCSQAKRFIGNVINLVHSAFHLVIIHGFNHGTAIKDMLADSFENPHIVSQYLDPMNMGVTHMQIVV